MDAMREEVEYEVGEVVQVRFNGMFRGWFPGKIVKNNQNQTYQIHFEDGYFDKKIRSQRIRRIREECSQKETKQAQADGGIQIKRETSQKKPKQGQLKKKSDDDPKGSQEGNERQMVKRKRRRSVESSQVPMKDIWLMPQPGKVIDMSVAMNKWMSGNISMLAKGTEKHGQEHHQSGVPEPIQPIAGSLNSHSSKKKRKRSGQDKNESDTNDEKHHSSTSKSTSQAQGKNKEQLVEEELGADQLTGPDTMENDRVQEGCLQDKEKPPEEIDKPVHLAKKAKQPSIQEEEAKQNAEEQDPQEEEGQKDPIENGPFVEQKKVAHRFKVGDRVEAAYHGGAWYSGSVTKVTKTGSCDVLYDDGEKECGVGLEFLRLQPFKVGDRVEGAFAGGADWYPGVVTKVTLKGRYTIKYDDGDREYNVKAKLLRHYLNKKATELNLSKSSRKKKKHSKVPKTKVSTEGIQETKKKKKKVARSPTEEGTAQSPTKAQKPLCKFVLSRMKPRLAIPLFRPNKQAPPRRVVCKFISCGQMKNTKKAVPNVPRALNKIMDQGRAANLGKDGFRTPQELTGKSLPHEGSGTEQEEKPLYMSKRCRICRLKKKNCDRRAPQCLRCQRSNSLQSPPIQCTYPEDAVPLYAVNRLKPKLSNIIATSPSVPKSDKTKSFGGKVCTSPEGVLHSPTSLIKNRKLNDDPTSPCFSPQSDSVADSSGTATPLKVVDSSGTRTPLNGAGVVLPPRMYMTMACLSCKSVRKKCDRLIPHCLRCLQRQRECVYPGAAIKTSQPPKASTKRRLKSKFQKSGKSDNHLSPKGELAPITVAPEQSPTTASNVRKKASKEQIYMDMDCTNCTTSKSKCNRKSLRCGCCKKSQISCQYPPQAKKTTGPSVRASKVLTEKKTSENEDEPIRKCSECPKKFKTAKGFELHKSFCKGRLKVSKHQFALLQESSQEKNDGGLKETSLKPTKKDKNAPKKGRTAYQLFMSELTKEHPGQSFSDISKLCGKRWKEMSDESRLKYDNLSKMDKQRYEEELNMQDSVNKGGKKIPPQSPDWCIFRSAKPNPLNEKDKNLNDVLCEWSSQTLAPGSPISLDEWTTVNNISVPFQDMYLSSASQNMFLIKPFTAVSTPDGQTLFNACGSVWALHSFRQVWSSSNDVWIAVGTGRLQSKATAEQHVSLKQFHLLQEPISYPNLLQFWKMSKDGKVSLQFAVGHTSGAVWQLQWHPSLTEASAQSRPEKQVDAVAGVFSDGTVRVFSVMRLADEASKKLQSPNACPGPLVWDQQPCTTLSLPGALLTCLSWGPQAQSVLLTGTSEGMVLTWRVSPSKSKEDAWEATILQHFNAGSGVSGNAGMTTIRSVVWCPVADNMFAAIGNSGILTIWDTLGSSFEPVLARCIASNAKCSLSTLKKIGVNLQWVLSGRLILMTCDDGMVSGLDLDSLSASISQFRTLSAEVATWALASVNLGSRHNHEELVVTATGHGQCNMFKISNLFSKRNQMGIQAFQTYTLAEKHNLDSENKGKVSQTNEKPRGINIYMHFPKQLDLPAFESLRTGQQALSIVEGSKLHEQKECKYYHIIIGSFQGLVQVFGVQI